VLEKANVDIVTYTTPEWQKTVFGFLDFLFPFILFFVVASGFRAFNAWRREQNGEK
jgi:hypothetical protein